jgi:hypothetical protein
MMSQRRRSPCRTQRRLHGAEKSFIIRLPTLNNADAWHWASCDAGVGVIPKFGRERVQKVSKPKAEQYGITDVRWRPSGQQAREELGIETAH